MSQLINTRFLHMETITNCLPHYRRGGKCEQSRSRDATGDWCFRYAIKEEDDKDRCSTNAPQFRLQYISGNVALGERMDMDV